MMKAFLRRCAGSSYIEDLILFPRVGDFAAFALRFDGDLQRTRAVVGTQHILHPVCPTQRIRTAITARTWVASSLMTRPLMKTLSLASAGSRTHTFLPARVMATGNLRKARACCHSGRLRCFSSQKIAQQATKVLAHSVL